MTLLYHQEGFAGQSPFDKAVLAAAQGEAVMVVCPYIGMGYLNRLLSVSASWQLVTDVNAWLESLGLREMQSVVDFISKHLSLIRHHEGVHAKAVIGSRSAYVGSANLTQMGMLMRTELGIQIQDRAQLRELREWFLALWGASELIDTTQLSELVAWQAHERAAGRHPPARQAPKIGHKPMQRLARPVSVTRPATAAPPAPGPDLDELLMLFIERRAIQGFTFRELHKATNHLASSRQLYLALLPFCADLPRSVFRQDTVNRLLYKRGRFWQSDAGNLSKALAPYDSFLQQVVSQLNTREFLIAHPVQVPGLRPRAQSLLIGELIRTGLLQEQVGALRLNRAWTWSKRFQLFQQSYTTWLKMLSSHSPPEPASAQADRQPPEAPAPERPYEQASQVATEFRSVEADGAMAALMDVIQGRGTGLARKAQDIYVSPQAPSPARVPAPSPSPSTAVVRGTPAAASAAQNEETRRLSSAGKRDVVLAAFIRLAAQNHFELPLSRQMQLYQVLASSTGEGLSLVEWLMQRELQETAPLFALRAMPGRPLRVRLFRDRILKAPLPRCHFALPADYSSPSEGAPSPLDSFLERVIRTAWEQGNPLPYPSIEALCLALGPELPETERAQVIGLTQPRDGFAVAFTVTPTGVTLQVRTDVAPPGLPLTNIAIDDLDASRRALFERRTAGHFAPLQRMRLEQDLDFVDRIYAATYQLAGQNHKGRIAVRDEQELLTKLAGMEGTSFGQREVAPFQVDALLPLPFSLAYGDGTVGLAPTFALNKKRGLILPLTYRVMEEMQVRWAQTRRAATRRGVARPTLVRGRATD